MNYKIALCSLGCAKNLVDSERMLAILKNLGYSAVSDYETADIIIVNTCGFIESAKKESIDTILEYAAYKEKSCKALVVTGCLVQKYQQDLSLEIPEVDLWLGSLNFEEIGERLGRILSDTEETPVYNCDYSNYRELSTPSHWAYLKIAEGCSNQCTFCVIPQMRGPYKSRKMEDIVAETRGLIQKGVKEVILLAQDTTLYGKDIYGTPKLKELLKALCKEDLRWIRILYSYPHRIDRELLELMAKEEKICSYLDIPMQHSEDSILKAMGRPERKDKLKKLIQEIRETDPNYVIRSTFIVGFPGETQEDFQGLCDFLQTSNLDWVGVFPYSQEEDTVAATLPNQISEEIKENRYHYIMSLLSRCSANTLEKWRDSIITVVVDGDTDREEAEANGCSCFGRAWFQAPDVDGLVYIKEKQSHKPGDEIKVRIVATDVYDLIGEEI